MTLHRTRRPGLSLVEVIVAMFIMALGMIALLTLFPLGALQMGQALKDDRCAQAAAIADNVMRTHCKRFVFERSPGTQEPFANAFRNPQDATYGVPNPAKPLVPAAGVMPMPVLVSPGANEAEPSYPVFVDPRGYDGRAGNLSFAQERLWVAGGNTAIGSSGQQPRIPRRPFANSVNPAPAPGGLPGFSPFVSSYRTCTLLDDLSYDENGSARRLDSNNTQLPVERQGRYTWAWMLQVPALGNPNLVNMTVVVYDTRNPDYPANDGEIAYTVGFTPGSTSVSFAFPAGQVPNIRAGSWILDGSMQNQFFPAAQGIPRYRLANFYRVTGFEIDEAANVIRLDLQTPIKPLPTGTYPAANGTYPGTLYVLKGVSEVFERRPINVSDVPE